MILIFFVCGVQLCSIEVVALDIGHRCVLGGDQMKTKGGQGTSGACGNNAGSGRWSSHDESKIGVKPREKGR